MPYGNFATFSESPEYWEMIVEAMLDAQDPAEAASEIASLIRNYIDEVVRRAMPKLIRDIVDDGLISRQEMDENSSMLHVDMVDSYWDVIKTELEKIRALF
jgi:hypothetical protein